jgi:hypothetical protein
VTREVEIDPPQHPAHIPVDVTKLAIGDAFRLRPTAPDG